MCTVVCKDLCRSNVPWAAVELTGNLLFAVLYFAGHIVIWSGANQSKSDSGQEQKRSEGWQDDTEGGIDRTAEHARRAHDVDGVDGVGGVDGVEEHDAITMAEEHRQVVRVAIAGSGILLPAT